MVYEAFFGSFDESNPLNYLNPALKPAAEESAAGEDGSGEDGSGGAAAAAAAAVGGGGDAAKRDEDGPPPPVPPEPELDDARVRWAMGIFNGCFLTETERLLTLTKLWENEDGSEKRRKPQPLAVGVVDALNPGADGDGGQGQPALGAFDGLDELNDQEPLPVRTAALLFLRAAALLQGSSNRPFDKDDPLACEFVVAACNLRGAAFHMDALSPFKAKEMAGNIIAGLTHIALCGHHPSIHPSI